MKVQSTKRIDTATLKDGYTLDFDSSQHYCFGVAVIHAESDNLPLYEDSRMQLLFDTEEILPELTPISLLQSSVAVSPNQRFFRFKKRVISSKKFTVKGIIPASQTVIVMFLLDEKNGTNPLRQR